MMSESYINLYNLIEGVRPLFAHFEEMTFDKSSFIIFSMLRNIEQAAEKVLQPFSF